ncbi:hypothetical protein QUA41_11135 [Microcoleus sp. Pol11C1]|uniref:hypothetical protein n=1 Tax=unclassified Microcoleus TaxID=2642155 RepID=UPI002FD447A6
MSHLQIPKTDSRLILKIGLDGGSISIDQATQGECFAFVRLAIAAVDRLPAIDLQNVLADVCQPGYAHRAAIWNELTPSPANHIPRADGLRIRKFTPKNLSYSHENICRIPADLSVSDSHCRSKPPPKKLANFRMP